MLRYSSSLMPSLPPLTVFDVETTGLDPRRGHRIIEIAGVRIEQGNILTESAFTSFVNPERSLPFEARQVNGISEEDVRNAPTIMTVLPRFLEFTKASILVAHNAVFDKSFLDAEKEFCWGYVNLPEILCSLTLSRNLFPTMSRHNLDVLSERFHMPLPAGRHRALPDVLQTAAIFLKMLDAGKIQSMEELRRRESIEQAVAR